MTMAHVLVVDDDATVLRLVERALQEAEFTVATAHTGDEAISALGDAPWDVVVTDLRLPGKDGLEVLREVKAFDDTIEVILISAYGDIPTAVHGMREGSYDFLTKPFSHPDQVRTAVQRAVEKRRLERELTSLRQHVAGRTEFGGMIGRSLPMQQVYQRIELVAPTRSTVLVVGETGTGKELVARAIHNGSPRADAPFVAVNCGALPSGLLESELYGHVKGAFTGAVGTKIGMFEAAAGGTIFLDEVNSMELASQAALLRTLDTGELRPVGSATVKHVDVRVLAATNRPLTQALADGTLREDLFYRLSAVTIGLPPLRERTEDVPLLCDKFLEELSAAHQRPAPRLPPELVAQLQNYAWPGNVRELRHALEQAVIFTPGPVIAGDAFPFLDSPAPAPVTAPVEQPVHDFAPLADFERVYIERVLNHTGQNKAEAAKILGLPRTSLYKRMERLGIKQRPDARATRE